MAPLHWRLPALWVLSLAVPSLSAHRTDCPGRHREGRDRVYSALHRKSNPVPNSVVSKCLPNETSFWSDCQVLYFHRSEGKREERGEDGRKAGPPQTDQVQRPNGKLSWKWSALHGPAVPAWPRDLLRPTGAWEQNMSRSSNTPRHC